jgi:hypothetical protein
MAVEIRCDGCGKSSANVDEQFTCSCPQDNGIWDIVGILIIYGMGISFILFFYFIGVFLWKKF